MEGKQLFNVLVAGEEPEETMLKYDSNVKVEPYKVYEYKKAQHYKDEYLKSLTLIYNQITKDKSLNIGVRPEALKEEIEDIKNMSAEDYYFDMLTDLPSDQEVDDISGDVYTRTNPNGKFMFHKVAGHIALPFILKDGREVYTAYKEDIDWDKIHLANRRPYEVAWDTVVEGKLPNGENEKKIYENMKNRTEYFANFESREHYINANTAFWEFAFVDENGWHEPDKNTAQFDWIINFYDKFIKPLPDGTKLTIYECARERD